MSQQEYGAAGSQPYPPYTQGIPQYPDEKSPLAPYPGGAPMYPGGAPAMYPGGTPTDAGGNPPYPGGNPPYPSPGVSVDQISYQGPTQASCPPLEDMDQVAGYGNIGFEEVLLPPPPPYEQATGETPERHMFEGVETLTAEDVQQALLEHVQDECCWGTGPAKSMIINEITPHSAYRLTLETFTEARSTKWKSEPFHSGNVVVTGPAPGPWDVPASPPTMFKKATIDIEVPNTASVKPCHKCNGRGYDNCFFCNGRGMKDCNSCGASGFREVTVDGESTREQCSCNGGMERCFQCNGTGRKDCHECKGRGSLRWFICLTVKWKNHDKDHVEQKSSLPDKLVKDVSGDLVLDETNPRVWPVNNFPIQEINKRSNEFVSEHSTKYTMERILMQRQRIHCVPISHVHYSLPSSSDTGSYFVYGREKKIHAPDYPAQCCCGCSIL